MHLAVRRSRETASWKEDVAKERTTSPRAHVVVRRAAALHRFFFFAVDFFLISVFGDKKFPIFCKKIWDFWGGSMCAFLV